MLRSVLRSRLLFCLLKPRCRLQILETAVRTGTDEDLIDRGSLENAGITDLVYLGRACHNRHKILGAVGDGAQIFCILIAF